MKVAQIVVVVLFALLILVVAGHYRVGELAERPMHGDEAVNTFKFKDLYEDNAYRYDPTEYHGPTLPYLTLVAAWVHPETEFAEFPEEMYRGIIVAIGLVLVAVTVLIGGGLGYGAALFAALFIAISPAMAFYSRYYIHEMPLVLFTLLAILAGWRYAVTGRVAWAAALGLSLGLMHATKETAIIAWFAAAVATGVTLLIHHRRELKLDTARALFIGHLRAAGTAVVVWAAVAVVLFSSFFTHARGPLDSVLTFWSYVDRGTGGEPMHIQPWHYYLSLLGWHQPVEALVWSEGLILALAAVGVLAAFVGWGVDRRHVMLARWVGVFTLVLIAVYTLIPYKTPWNVLGFLHGLTLMAGVGAVALAWGIPRSIGSMLARQRPALVAVPLGLIVLMPIGYFAWQLAGQTELTVDRLQAHPRNPWVYAHPSRSVVELGDRLEELATIHSQRADMPVLVFHPGNYWPIPWYLRRLNQVGYFPHAPQEDIRAPVMIIEGHLDDEAKLWERLEQTHSGPHYTGLRPGHNVAFYVEQELWDAYIDRRR